MRTGIFLVFIVAAFMLSSCSSQKNALVKPAEMTQQPSAEVLKRQPQSTDAPKLQPQVADVPKLQLPAAVVTKHQPQVSPLHRKVVSLLEKKNYRQAIELMNGRSLDGVEKEYVLAINGLLGVGDGAFSRGDYASAGRAFKVVLDAYPAEPSLRERVGHDPKQIKSNLETCANRLMEQGLEEYRRGRLESAIRKWKGVLAINPGHQQAKKSIETATVQLQTLQNLKSR
jgi:tetratricopeptide (TPR) repeat protein